jgi:Leucine-rich repeat (LRR) protein
MTSTYSVLKLPSDYSSGKITIYDQDGSEPVAIMDARGTINLPSLAKVYLDLSQEVCDDLSRINLIPHALLGGRIAMVQKDLSSTDFVLISDFDVQTLTIVNCRGFHTEQLIRLKKPTTLEHLNLAFTPVDDLSFAWLRRFPELRSIRLASTNADDRCIHGLMHLARLTNLDLRRTNVTDKSVRNLWSVAPLSVVDLAYCKVGEKALTGIRACRNLRTLNISHTAIGDRAVEALVADVLGSSLPLSVLSLRGSSITDRSLISLASLKGLLDLDVRDTAVSEDGVKFFEGAAPECRILRDQTKRPALKS